MKTEKLLCLQEFLPWIYIEPVESNAFSHILLLNSHIIFQAMPWHAKLRLCISCTHYVGNIAVRLSLLDFFILIIFGEDEFRN
jgi:hypothetical protein